jgi:hypothetical protein
VLGGRPHDGAPNDDNYDRGAHDNDDSAPDNDDGAPDNHDDGAACDDDTGAHVNHHQLEPTERRIDPTRVPAGLPGPESVLPWSQRERAQPPTADHSLRAMADVWSAAAARLIHL